MKQRSLKTNFIIYISIKQDQIQGSFFSFVFFFSERKFQTPFFLIISVSLLFKKKIFLGNFFKKREGQFFFAFYSFTPPKRNRVVSTCSIYIFLPDLIFFLLCQKNSKSTASLVFFSLFFDTHFFFSFF